MVAIPPSGSLFPSLLEWCLCSFRVVDAIISAMTSPIGEVIPPFLISFMAINIFSRLHIGGLSLWLLISSVGAMLGAEEDLSFPTSKSEEIMRYF